MAPNLKSVRCTWTKKSAASKFLIFSFDIQKNVNQQIGVKFASVFLAGNSKRKKSFTPKMRQTRRHDFLIECHRSNFFFRVRNRCEVFFLADLLPGNFTIGFAVNTQASWSWLSVIGSKPSLVPAMEF